jgi:hypothetical protein
MLVELEFFRQIVEKSSRVKFYKNPSELFYAGGRTDKHDETNSRFSQFSERAKEQIA